MCLGYLLLGFLVSSFVAAVGTAGGAGDLHVLCTGYSRCHLGCKRLCTSHPRPTSICTAAGSSNSAVAFLCTFPHAPTLHGFLQPLQPQIVDDILDLTASSSILGKPALNDIKSGLATVPVRHFGIWAVRLSDIPASRYAHLTALRLREGLCKLLTGSLCVFPEQRHHLGKTWLASFNCRPCSCWPAGAVCSGGAPADASDDPAQVQGQRRPESGELLTSDV